MVTSTGISSFVKVQASTGTNAGLTASTASTHLVDAASKISTLPIADRQAC